MRRGRWSYQHTSCGDGNVHVTTQTPDQCIGNYKPSSGLARYRENKVIDGYHKTSELFFHLSQDRSDFMQPPTPRCANHKQ